MPALLILHRCVPPATHVPPPRNFCIHSFYLRQIHPEPFLGSPSSAIGRIALLEEPRKHPRWDFEVVAPVATSSKPPSSAAVHDNGGTYRRLHVPGHPLDVPGTCSLLVFLTAPVSTPPPAPPSVADSADAHQFFDLQRRPERPGAAPSVRLGNEQSQQRSHRGE